MFTSTQLQYNLVCALTRKACHTICEIYVCKSGSTRSFEIFFGSCRMPHNCIYEATVMAVKVKMTIKQLVITPRNMAPATLELWSFSCLFEEIEFL